MPDEPRVTAEERVAAAPRVKTAFGREGAISLPRAVEIAEAHAAAEVEHATAELRGQKQTLNEILAVEREQKMAAEAEVRRLREVLEDAREELQAAGCASVLMTRLAMILDEEPHTEDSDA